MLSASFEGRAESQFGPSKRLVPVVPSNDTPLAHGPTRGLYVGAGGSLRVEDAYGNVVNLVSAASQYHPISVARISADGTTAAAIIALY